MNLDKLSQDIKTSLVYVTNLKTENETLQSKIGSLEQQNAVLQTLLKEREQSFNDLLKQQSINENTVLDRIMDLQMDHKLKEEHKALTEAHKELQCHLQKTLEEHQKAMNQSKEEGEQRLRDEQRRKEKDVEAIRKEKNGREEELLEEIVQLKELVRKKDQERAEEKTKVR